MVTTIRMISYCKPDEQTPLFEIISVDNQYAWCYKFKKVLKEQLDSCPTMGTLRNVP